MAASMPAALKSATAASAARTAVSSSTVSGAAQCLAIASGDEFVRSFQRLASELGMAIALTYLEKWHGKPRNTVSLIDRRGEMVLTYAKVHTCDFSKEAAFEPGDAFKVAELETDGGPVRIGMMICLAHYSEIRAAIDHRG